MISRTYINEVDINYVSEDQEVDIGLDAFPDKNLTGTVVEVANIGEQRPNTDAKVSQILIEIHEADILPSDVSWGEPLSLLREASQTIIQEPEDT